MLQSQKDNKYYIGITSELSNRLDYHNSGRQRSTKHRIPFSVVHTEIFPSKAKALITL